MTQGSVFPAALNDAGAYDIAQAMLDGFNRHYRLFRETSAAAKARFDQADLHHAVLDVLRRQQQLGRKV